MIINVTPPCASCTTFPNIPAPAPPPLPNTEQVALQDARSRAQIELPEASTQALLRIYRTHAPDKLPFVEPLLAKLAAGQPGAQ